MDDDVPRRWWLMTEVWIVVLLFGPVATAILITILDGGPADPLKTALNWLFLPYRVVYE